MALSAIFSDIDTERVISEVRQRPALWDSSHELYKDKEARCMFWTGVFESLFPDFNEEDILTKREIERTVQQRWKTARDAYMRSKNILKNTSIIPVGKNKIYAYYDHMKFLDNKDLIEYDVEVSPTTSEVTTKKPRKRKSQNNNILENNEFCKQMMTMFKENDRLLKNDDLLFFMSLLPITESFTTPQKMIFRSEILRKAMEISDMSNPFDALRVDIKPESE